MHSRKTQISLHLGIDAQARVNLFASTGVANWGASIASDLAVAAHLTSQSNPAAALAWLVIVDIGISTLVCARIWNCLIPAAVPAAGCHVGRDGLHSGDENTSGKSKFAGNKLFIYPGVRSMWG